MSPDGSAKPPPEEKLLRLIRGKGAKPAAGSASQAVEAPAVVVTALNLRAHGRKVPWPAFVAAALGAALVIEVVCLIAQAVWPLPTIDVPVVATPPSETIASGPQQPAPALPEVASVAASASRPLFASVASTPNPSSTSHAAPSGSAKLLASRLTLMGIVSGDPSQAIIQDAETQKTYFVSPGQAVAEGAVVEQIFDNRVVLDLGGEKIELTL